MPNDYHKPTEEELRDIFRPDDPKPIAPAPEEPMRVSDRSKGCFVNKEVK